MAIDNNIFHKEMEEKYGIYPNFIYRPKDRLIKGLVANVGINDVEFVVQPRINGKQICHPLYKIWKGMLERCFDGPFSELHSTYVGVTCSETFKSLKLFSLWALSAGYKPTMQLDKDLLDRSSKLYSEDTCIFIPQNINIFITLKKVSELPFGVSLGRNKVTNYIAQISIGDRKVHLGSFNTKEEAHQAWQKAKLEQAIAFNFPPLQRVIDQLTFEIENNLETTSL